MARSIDILIRTFPDPVAKIATPPLERAGAIKACPDGSMQ